MMLAIILSGAAALLGIPCSGVLRKILFGCCSTGIFIMMGLAIIAATEHGHFLHHIDPGHLFHHMRHLPLLPAGLIGMIVLGTLASMMACGKAWQHTQVRQVREVSHEAQGSICWKRVGLVACVCLPGVLLIMGALILTHVGPWYQLVDPRGPHGRAQQTHPCRNGGDIVDGGHGGYGGDGDGDGDGGGDGDGDGAGEWDVYGDGDGNGGGGVDEDGDGDEDRAYGPHDGAHHKQHWSREVDQNVEFVSDTNNSSQDRSPNAEHGHKEQTPDATRGALQGQSQGATESSSDNQGTDMKLGIGIFLI